ncbi:MAG: DUF4920 domain-containing protein [Polyangiales bacterium]
MRCWGIVGIALVMAAGCESTEEETESATATATASESASEAEGKGKGKGKGNGTGSEELFGEALSDLAVTSLDDIAAAPQQFEGQRVKTEGTIERVCQKKGCWMELRSEQGATLRVPMAGHSFFLPKDSAGRECTVEGKVLMKELSEDEREHLAAEGAKALASATQLEATGVRFR